MNGPPTGKVALVTGVSREAGIGAAIAREFASAGASLFISHFQLYDQNQPWGIAEGEPEQILADLRAGGADAEAGASTSWMPRSSSATTPSTFAHPRFYVSNSPANTKEAELDSPVTWPLSSGFWRLRKADGSPAR